MAKAKVGFGPRVFSSLHKKPSAAFCSGCTLEHAGHGFVHARGPETSPILFVGEAPGPEELKSGVPFIGPAGSMLARLLKMIGKEPDDYRYDNIIRCLPPNMELSGTPYESMAVAQCHYRDQALSNPQHRVIVPLGAVATKTLLGLGKGASVEDLHGTVHPLGDGRVIVPTYHPSHLQRGAHNLMGVVLFDLQRAFEVVEQGWPADPGVIVEDPPLDWFTAWVDMVEAAWLGNPGSFWTSCDIETPDKAGGKSEGELGPDDLSYVIERVNWSCNPDEGVTVPYVGGYIAQCDRLFRLNLVMLLWNEDYDLRRLANAGHPIPDITYDGMEMFHMLQSDLPRGLGFAAPFYSRFGAWKHLAKVRPAFYGGVDGLQNQRTCYGIAADLQKMGQWEAYRRHCYEVRKYALRPTEALGLRVDEPALDAFIVDMTAKARTAMHALQPLAPIGVCPLQPEAGLKKKPEGAYTKATDLKKDGTAKKQPLDELKRELFADATLIEKLVLREITVCRACGKQEVAKTHRCEDKTLTPQIELDTATVVRWFWQEPFNPDSRDQVLEYVKLKGHEPGRNRKSGAESVDRKTLDRLWAKTKDPFYKHLLDLRAVQKVRGTYGIGMKRRLRNGRVFGRFTFKPSTQRLSSVDPNLTNVVADKGDQNTLAAGFRKCIVAGSAREHHPVSDADLARWAEKYQVDLTRPDLWQTRLLETDYSGIEAKILGWVAHDPDYIRLASLGPHGCLAYYAIGDPPDLAQPDDVLAAKFKQMKDGSHPALEKDPFLYDRSKRGVHGIGYGLTEYGMHNNWPNFFPTLDSGKKIIDIFYNKMAPKIGECHRRLRMQAQNQHYLGGEDHPFRYRHWFWSVVHYKMISTSQRIRRQKKGGWCVTINGRDYAVEWGEDSKRAIAFYPQSIAAGILKEAMLALFTPGSEDYIGDAYYGRTPLRAPIHDSLLQEIPVAVWDVIVPIVARVMQRPVPQLPLNPAWGMGEFLTIGVDGKACAPGASWAEMAKLPLPKAGLGVLETVSDAPAMIEDEDDEEMPESMGTIVLGEGEAA